ncbi:AMP-binding protein, partial [Cutibacterium acnes]|uniref:AMP-binding protein n=1 Tax=Cutibacterium acnes TaxID=1747 RepID=UPI0001F09CE9
PEARRKHIKTITNAVAIFTDTTLRETEVKAPLGDTFLERVDDPYNVPSYCFFTSGSTGEPKGALIAQTGMMNHLHSKVHLLQLGAGSVVAQTAPTTFDVSIWQFCAALLVGGTVRIVPDDISRDPHELFSLLEEKRITHIELVPTVFRELIHEIGSSVSFSGLEYVLVTGEELPLRLARDWVEKFPAVPLINAYGPTECSDDVTHAVVDGESLNSGE